MERLSRGRQAAVAVGAGDSHAAGQSIERNRGSVSLRTHRVRAAGKDGEREVQRRRGALGCSGAAKEGIHR